MVVLMVRRVRDQVLERGLVRSQAQRRVIAHRQWKDIVEPPYRVQHRDTQAFERMRPGRIDRRIPPRRVQDPAVDGGAPATEMFVGFIKDTSQRATAPVDRKVIDELVEPKVRQVVGHVQLRHAAAPRVHGREEVRAGDPRNDRFEGRMPTRHRGPLREPEVRVAPHPDDTVRPGLGDDPVERVVAVLDLVDEGQRLALGTELAAHVLGDEHVPAVVEPGRELRHERVAATLVVGQPYEHRRCPTRSVREVDVRRQTDSVTHGRHGLFGSRIEWRRFQVVHLVRHTAHLSGRRARRPIEGAPPSSRRPSVLRADPCPTSKARRSDRAVVIAPTGGDACGGRSQARRGTACDCRPEPFVA